MIIQAVGVSIVVEKEIAGKNSKIGNGQIKVVDSVIVKTVFWLADPIYSTVVVSLVYIYTSKLIWIDMATINYS